MLSLIGKMILIGNLIDIGFSIRGTNDFLFQNDRSDKDYIASVLQPKTNIKFAGTDYNFIINVMGLSSEFEWGVPQEIDKLK